MFQVQVYDYHPPVDA
ncbi:hypothetical protein TIFTF001_051942 [Ficus carica]|uniref:Uncharacterized protein n=1 Tax=Ficus carica TaxID=3494 RepID=A0AA88JCX3_FICCA|nr:hypothetical protein TIFTF001_051942 [Ficus carica]